ncbi:PREDICTED: subtilisin-like protease SBT3.9 isoform X1 [Ipomoea nil]|uniref:subtilisin-like protease SBT3.9 isoform X1 n=1 Tax=Ipomoea nil TaxID=35883 RepID=UPI0009018310|nr:PREDICTED: subtilisin-like protease SBT3.9 isoform X1 [Ipomoea nil]
MDKNKNIFILFSFFFVSLLLFQNANVYTSALSESKVYIVYMGARQHDDVDRITSTHHDMLTSVLGSREGAVGSMIYSYRHGFSGFAAMMTKSQAQTITNLPGVVKVMPNSVYKLQTTRTWDYLGLPFNSANNLLNDTNMGDDIIVAVLDSGVTPENEAYNDKGVGPIPSKWKGYCQSGELFDPKKNCNRKLIGARYFIDGYLAYKGQPGSTIGIRDYISPRDSNGHGTHTSSTAAGSPVSNVSYKGLSLGTLRGGAPRARLAIYKIGWEDGIFTDADILKAFDTAIHDGVDVISASFGADVPLYSELYPQAGAISFGSFHAVAQGITVVAAGGNAGPAAQTVSNGEPWIITVAANTPDRAFPTPITLGNGQTLMGQSLFTGKDTGVVNLVAARGSCETLSTMDTYITGNVVLCFTGSRGSDLEVLRFVIRARAVVRGVGGLGIIVSQKPFTLLDAYADSFPSAQVDYEIGTKILSYIASIRYPKVRLSPSKTQIGKPISSVIAKYSSRGPYTIAPAILKPDIAAPGTNILAAYVPENPNIRISTYKIISGTSMATPHVAGIVALLKAANPNWSPAAIKSAIVTTAWTSDPSSGQPIFNEGETISKLADAFDHGGGIINPNKARSPGLIYDMSTTDYLQCLCAMGYDSRVISGLAGQATSCNNGLSIFDVNFPSITMPNLNGTVTLTRTVTNVGPVNSVYKVMVEPPKGITVSVTPSTLNFNPSVKKISFSVKISTSYLFNTGYYFGSLTWNDGVNNVRIPISVKTMY